MSSENDETFEMDVNGCARCGNDHKAVTFKRFRHPVANRGSKSYSHFGECPENGQPILLAFFNLDEPT